MLEVFTSRIWLEDKDKLDITIKSAKQGKIFAPTWEMVMDYKNKIISDSQYTAMYYDLMRKSYANNKEQWESLLNKERVVLVCYCNHGQFCHRYLLADILEKLGASYKGEIELKK